MILVRTCGHFFAFFDRNEARWGIAAPEFMRPLTHQYVDPVLGDNLEASCMKHLRAWSLQKASIIAGEGCLSGIRMDQV